MTLDERTAVTIAAAECIRMALAVDEFVDAKKADRREMARRLEAQLRGVCERLNKVREADAAQRREARERAGRV